MARIRSVKPGFFASLDIAELPRDTRLHFVGLWTYADDHGRGVDDARLIKAAVWPLDDDITADDVERMQDELAKHDRIIRYAHAGRLLFQVCGWDLHQHPNRPQESRYPGPHDAGAVVPHGGRTEAARSTHVARSADAVRTHVGRTSVVGVGEGEVEGLNPLSTDVDGDDGFDGFWATYPARNGKRLHRDKAAEQWRRLKPAERQAATVGAGHYADAYQQGLPGVGAADAFRWLRDRSWGDWQTPADADGQARASPRDAYSQLDRYDPAAWTGPPR